MKLATLLDPIDSRFMPGESTNGGLRVSNSAAAILVFLVGQMFFAIWWAGSMNEKMNYMANAIRESQLNRDSEVKLLRADIEYLKTYNQKTREQFAANGWTLDGEGNLKRASNARNH